MARAAKAQTSKPEKANSRERKDEPATTEESRPEPAKSKDENAETNHVEPNKAEPADLEPKDVEPKEEAPKSTEQNHRTDTTTDVEKAIALGKEMMKQSNVTKADVARKMYELINEEPRDVIVQAFVDGAGLTPKGAMTYFYNCKRKRARR